MPRSNIALVAATAVVTALLTTTLPAVARAGYDAMNSDKVDGKHAVSAGATEKSRRGRLVATSPRTGRLPNNIIAKAPDASRLESLNSTAFLQRDGKARDADKLDGRDLRNVMPKAWTFDLVGDDRGTTPTRQPSGSSRRRTTPGWSFSAFLWSRPSKCVGQAT